MNLALLCDIPASIVEDAPALIDGRGEQTYGSLRAAVARASGLLAAHGIGAGDPVGIMSTNRREVVEVMLAAACRGAATVPFNVRASKDEMAHLLADSGVRIVFCEPRYVELVEWARPETLSSLLVFDDTHLTSLDDPEPDWDVVDVDDEELAVLLYTSGTTSLPKGVILTHGGLTGYVMAANDAADGTESGCSLLAAPLYHVAGLTSLLNALWSGRRTVLMPQFEAGEWLDAVARYGVSHAFLVPTMMSRILDHPAFNGTDLSSLEHLTYGAAPMPPPLIERAIGAFPKQVAFAQAYGQTETTATVAVLSPEDHRIDEGEPDIAAKRRRLASVGQVVEDVEVCIVDSDGKALEPGEVGEVWLRTARAMRGYWRSEDSTKAVIDSENWVHTGDLGSIDEDGYLFLAGRANDLIIRGGENIAPEEVEVVLYEHPEVIEAAAVGLPDEEWGERVVAAAVVRGGSAVDEAELLALCSDRLAAHKRPERVVLLDALPRTSTGKVVRRQLRALLEAAGEQ